MDSSYNYKHQHRCVLDVVWRWTFMTTYDPFSVCFSAKSKHTSSKITLKWLNCASGDKYLKFTLMNLFDTFRESV